MWQIWMPIHGKQQEQTPCISHPRFIRTRTIDGRYLRARNPHINGKLPAMVDLVQQHLPEKIQYRYVAKRLGSYKKLNCTAQAGRRNFFKYRNETPVNLVQVSDGGTHGFCGSRTCPSFSRPVKSCS